MAAEASADIAQIRQRLSDLELSNRHKGVAEALRKERAETLISLRAILEAFKTESGGAASNTELEQLREENKALAKINAKQRYRIEHLSINLREAIASNSNKSK
mmetsp:Transcript_17298/g.40232  ORF Transcript_17298/g.40232 Transcript_17298/m.40232 type:complete len:104 (+) Transcript_17298:240-551(+)